jgi:hypothetical protein
MNGASEPGMPHSCVKGKGKQMPHIDETEYDMMIASLADKAYRAIVGNPENLPMDSDNPYEIACTQYAALMAADNIVRKVMEAVEDRVNAELNSALTNLRAYEDSPGIPKKEYRYQNWKTPCIHPGVFATDGKPTSYCPTCGNDIPIEKL